MAKLTHVEFYGTGGGCVMYSALVNDDAWLATDFDFAAYYDRNVEEVDKDFQNGVDYVEHYKTPSAPLPTWREILESIRKRYPDKAEYAQYIMERFDLDSVCTHEWEYPTDKWGV